MDKYPVLQNELARLEKLYSYDILDMEPEAQFDDLTKLAAAILDVPICLITLMDADWQTFISKVGTDMKGNHRELSFCKHCVVQEDILEVSDTTKDERFMNNPFVVSAPNLRYYIGSPLIDEDGYTIGTVCGYDMAPKEMTNFQKTALKQISNTVMRLIHLRKIDLDQKKYKGIFNLSQDLLCILSKEGEIKEVNPALSDLLGYSRKELTSKDISQWVHTEDIEVYRKLFEDYGKEQIRTGLIFRLRATNGEFRTIEWSCYLDPDLSLIVVSGHDITDAIKHKNELELAVKNANEANEMKDQFLSDMSHEIRTPLASVVGYNELLKTSDLTAEQKSYAEAVDIAAEHLMNMVNDVLDAYKFSHHEVALDPSPGNLETVMTKIKKLYDLKAVSKNVSLKLNFDANIPYSLNIDRTRLTQILSNLTSNAIKFTSEGSVTINADLLSEDEVSACVRFSVRDTGIGIAEASQKGIFERFAQADKAIWKQYGGTGLGLSIAYFLVERHNSTLKLQSSTGKGSMFSFDVVFSKADLKHLAATIQPSIPSLNGLKILLAEDNETLQVLCKAFITRNGGELFIASNGREAIEFLASNEVDVVLLDFQMPEMNGIETANHIREKMGLTLTIIGCSANRVEADYSDHQLRNIQSSIEKPYTESTLIAEVLTQHHLNEPPLVVDDFEAILNKLTNQEGDELVQEFRKIFKSRIPLDIAELEEAIREENIDQIKSKVHFLTTTLFTMKFEGGLSLISKIERSIEKGEKNESFIGTRDLINYLTSALNEYN